MTTLWLTIAAVACVSAAIKALGPVVVGGRQLSPSVLAVIALLAPALLAALVVTQTFAKDTRVVLDARALGVAAAAAALALRAPMLVAITLAAAATALARAFL
jgi:uncharacterized membrane protein